MQKKHRKSGCILYSLPKRSAFIRPSHETAGPRTNEAIQDLAVSFSFLVYPQVQWFSLPFGPVQT